jgi:hypothetical protein
MKTGKLCVYELYQGQTEKEVIYPTFGRLPAAMARCGI